MVNWKIPLASLNGPTPVKTPDGKILRTVGDAAQYIEKLPKSKTLKDPLWDFAAGQVLWAATVEQPLPFTWWAMKRAIYGETPPKPLPPSKKEQLKAKREKARRR